MFKIKVLCSTRAPKAKPDTALCSCDHLAWRSAAASLRPHNTLTRSAMAPRPTRAYWHFHAQALCWAERHAHSSRGAQPCQSVTCGHAVALCTCRAHWQLHTQALCWAERHTLSCHGAQTCQSAACVRDALVRLSTVARARVALCPAERMCMQMPVRSA